MKKLIVVDLDGTLLHDEFVMNPQSKDALILAKEAGHTIVIATGRSALHSLHFYEELGLDTPIINVNGSLVHHPTDASFAEIVEGMGIELMEELFRSEVAPYVKNCICEYKDHLYMLKRDEQFASWVDFKNRQDLAFGPLDQAPQKIFTRFTLQLEAGKDAEVREFLCLNFPEQFYFYQWDNYGSLVFELSKGGVNKASAVKAIAEKLGFEPKDIIVFGDGDNDIEMLEFAGTGVAMGNACDSLKAVADAVTLPHDAGGIAHYLYTEGLI